MHAILLIGLIFYCFAELITIVYSMKRLCIFEYRFFKFRAIFVARCPFFDKRKVFLVCFNPLTDSTVQALALIEHFWESPFLFYFKCHTVGCDDPYRRNLALFVWKSVVKVIFWVWRYFKLVWRIKVFFYRTTIVSCQHLRLVKDFQE